MVNSDRELPKWSQAQNSAPPAFGEHNETALNRFLGGAPGPVIIRLIFVSLLVGAFLYWLEISPLDIFNSLQRLAQHIYSLGFGAVREVFSYILAGAVIVIPVWLVVRLLSLQKRQ